MQCDKTIYPARKPAVNAIIAISRKHHQKMKVYWCSECDGYHIATIHKKYLLPHKRAKYPLLVTNVVKPKPQPRRRPKTTRLPAVQVFGLKQHKPDLNSLKKLYTKYNPKP